MINVFAQLWIERISIGGNSIIVNTRCTVLSPASAPVKRMTEGMGKL